MRKKQAIVPGLIILAVLFSACTKNKLPAHDFQSVALHECSAKLVEPYICFDSLLTDSRCPKGAVCVWEGNALIKVTFHESQASHTFVMSLKGYPSGGFPSDTAINGYLVTFTNLEPYPDINTPGQSEKKASFTITR
ncbi:MAG TPA: hypothetical protein VLS85_13725 [Hanamia sp.]|nr:hypothetical protein [Hanamia sp.]